MQAEEDRLVRVLGSPGYHTQVDFVEGVDAIGTTTASEAVATALDDFVSGPDNNDSVYAAKVTTSGRGEDLATSPADPPTIIPFLDNELVWLVQIHDVEEISINPNVYATGATPVRYLVDQIIYVKGNNQWVLASEIPPGPA